jgi:hypothetical protein
LCKADADLQTLYDRFEENEAGRGESFSSAHGAGHFSHRSFATVDH